MSNLFEKIQCYPEISGRIITTNHTINPMYVEFCITNTESYDFGIIPDFLDAIAIMIRYANRITTYANIE